jgi:peptide/nickel transport system permease protein
MGRFIARRLVGMILVLFAISVIVFLIFNVIPNSDPAQRMAGKNATPALVASINKDWGFEDPLPQQYLTMMKKVFSSELISYSNQLNVNEQIAKGLPATFSVAIGAAVIWMFFGIIFGYISAVRAGGATDRLLTVVALVGISLPVFVLAAVFLKYLAYDTGWFPSSGYVALTEEPLEWAYHLILPWTTLAIIYVGFYSRVLRSNMLDAMDGDYVRTARAKGLTEAQVMRRHVLRNSLIPIITLFGLDFGAVVFGGAILTEAIFSINGVGYYAYQATINLDLPPIMAVTLYGAFFVVLFNALVDIAYAYLDPRVRLGESAQ